jgi:hypothetical protein
MLTLVFNGSAMAQACHQYIWDLWWTKSHWDRFYSEYFEILRFSLVGTITPMLLTHIVLTTTCIKTSRRKLVIIK